MSDALSFLVKARPEAMGHYMAFVKDAGKRLDPKTRNLISVITKVHAQTERGLKQYLRRALREGCTAGEVIDALLMAFPALGLSKIVWAVDVILAMDLPEFADGALDAQPRWHDLGALASFASGATTRRVKVDGHAVFVHRDGETLRVWDGRCPHQGTDIPELALREGSLACPKHQWRFDVASGACIENGDRPLRARESRVEDGRLFAHW